MKAGVPVLNIVVSIFYFIFAGAVIYWVKLAHQRRNQPQQQTTEKLEEMKKQLNFNKLIAISWLKKYTLIGACMSKNRKYLVKEFFIMSIYAVTCLKINKITLWPVTFSLFLLPFVFAIFEILITAIEKFVSEREKAGKNQTVNNINEPNEHEIEIEAVVIEISHPNSVKNAQMSVSKQTSLVQILTVSLIAFITFILFYQTIFTLTNSISNSGQLNITSLIIILAIDQFAVRSGLGLIFFAVLKVLQKKLIINFNSNVVVSWLCSEEIDEALIGILKERRQRLRKQQENTALFLNHRQSGQAKTQPNQNNLQLNLLNLQPDTLSNNENQQHEEDDMERQVYLTTPEKQLFQGNELEQSIKDKSILHQILDNKQNQTINNQLNKSTLKSHQESKGLQDIISSKDDQQGDTENIKTEFNLQNSRSAKGQKKGKKKAKRLLKLTGNSPYLEYLPNMLKNIDKVKNAQKDKKML